MIGAGSWSALGYVVAATFPGAPPTPLYTFVDNTRLDILLFETLNDGGSAILSYHLYINGGSDGTPFYEVSTYDH